MYAICITVVGPGLLGAKKVSDVTRKMDVSLIPLGRDWQINTGGPFLKISKDVLVIKMQVSFEK